MSIIAAPPTSVKDPARYSLSAIDPQHLAGRCGVVEAPLSLASTIAADHRRFIKRGIITELRAFEENGPVVVSECFQDPIPGEETVYRDLGAMAELAVSLSGEYGIYAPVNPVRLGHVSGKAVKDSHIESRISWFLDYDRNKSRYPEFKDQCSTDAERAACFDLASQVDEFLMREFDIALPICGDSGNGPHRRYLIDLEADDAFRELSHGSWEKTNGPNSLLLRNATKALGVRFNNGDTLIDPNVWNPGRLCRLYGTTNCKGVPTDERPHRLSAITHIPEIVHVVTREQLEAVATCSPRPIAKPSNSAQKTVSSLLAKATPSDGPVRAYVLRAGESEASKLRATQEGLRNQQVNNSSFTLGTLVQQGGLTLAEGKNLMVEAVSGWSNEEKTLNLIDRALSAGMAQPRDLSKVGTQGAKVNGRKETNGTPPGGGQGRPDAEKWGGQPKRTDTGNAQRLAMRHGWKIRYCTAKGCWYVNDGQRFKEDDSLAIMRLASDTVRSIGAEAAEIVDDNDRRDTLKWAIQSEGRKNLDAMIYLARAVEGLQVTPMQLDVDPLLLNVRNGTIDLRTGKLRPHSPDDLITRMAPVDYDPDAKCPRFERFEREIYQDDEALIGYMRRQLGYGLTGLNTVQEMLILHGNGSNGKNVLMDTIMSILGDYAAQADATLLVTTKSEPHPTGLAGLEGRRFVYASETEAGKRMAEGLVKTITGNRVLKARMMHKDFYEFPATFKLYLLTNHEPIIEGMDEGIWRRLLKVPFLTKFVKPGEPVEVPTRLPIQPGLIDYFLEHEAPGILALLVRGCLDWQKGGMRPPDSVLAATDQYRSKMDTFGSFVEERCMQNETFQMSASELYQAYVSWAADNGIKRVANLRDFGQDMEQRGFKVKHTNRGNLRLGIALRAGDVSKPSTGDKPVADAAAEMVVGSF